MGEAEVPKGTGKLPDFDKLWDYAHPEISEQRFRELLPRALDSLDLSYLAQLLTQIARAEGLQRKFEDAHKTLDRVEKALLKAEADDQTRVRYLLERGRVFNSSGKRDEARPLFLQALDLAVKSKDDFNAVDAAHMMAIIETNEKALEFREKEGDLGKIMIAKWCVAKTLRMMDHTEEALEMQRNLFEQYQAAGKKSGYVYEEIAECLTVMGQEQEAQGWFAAAYEELSKDLRLSNEQDRLSRLRELGKVGRPETPGS